MNATIRVALAIFASATLATVTTAQTDGTYLLTSSNTVSPSSPSTTIEIWATWDDPVAWYGFGGANYDLAASDGLFSDPLNILNGPGSSTGIVNGNTVTGGINGQICIIHLCLPNNDNPILIASYTWTTADFTPRTVDLVTANTNNLIIGEYVSGAWYQLYPNEFTPGSGLINVVPAPAVWFVVAVPLAARARRRRT